MGSLANSISATKPRQSLTTLVFMLFIPGHLVLQGDSSLANERLTALEEEVCSLSRLIFIFYAASSSFPI